MKTNLTKLLREFPELKPVRVSDNVSLDSVEIDYVRSDSRQTNVNDLFCVPESSSSRKQEFISNAKASVILLKSGSDVLVPESKTVLEYGDDPERIQGPIASFLSGHPSREMEIVAVTGTNGKTSLTNILYSLAKDQGKRCGLIGTIGVKFGDSLIDTGYTTPDASSLNEILRKMKDEGINLVFMEASSHGLKLGRMNGISIRAGVFTNLTQDHLDFHPDMDDYFESKFRLFEILDFSRAPFGVLDRASAGGSEMFDRIRREIPELTIHALDGSADDWRTHNVSLSLQGTSYSVFKGNLSFGIETNLLGSFNVRNTALAFLTGRGLGFDETAMCDSLRTVPQIPGRFQIVYDKDRSRMAVVDYAHTPDALENIIRNVRDSKPKQLITLFGCGGDRDRTKRPKMARIAEELSDEVILTSDNPRTEEPESILDEIQAGFSNGFRPLLREADRAKAILRGVELLVEGGCLLVAGKGHEEYQIIGREKRRFSDVEEVQKAFGIF
ncbi:UDP-N-acetylmuramoyl-L-alanyl-D-glutamate--2,6-diaminopimelate ligase [Leptospira gomenensis]|uniref:UDP-N-acetylmuramoyl-L-alanyl-D-glutamate--2,6-diaminopimelate ligase n=1 Tax=Leptospira gomenensis TaxID=2484974 RepID=A0A5F1Z076_9LEPT|nr:UDP-N-acetylmuramoyl-L-alanyl-D-glutamate--2,6-diaminopimelate ligase [Leptospira gomenensis]TGK34469.1 UDP-N-acetylmuramoyl-L-alanyl-D-glutamate--2,6-diaminopimelate ligase [Leptospira gomenensis]TGK41855.1 UDP-N-acetylmuramoyl-L-alanyl-D-glutamate--2,6-diaminopimelate ligase [Leptospira gomenensis]TGK44792.1 UDP-N-acetylmuramoyl-L-alanyl-D-glutamate--2,6-diaminopimelate ligase [Leptospira gomenensis]TGK65179.1 UDP-N-acetylmuramoyl-L-alanyl-D-glutamate--2,6-diaminopimelate ligase [Leptospir